MRTNEDTDCYASKSMACIIDVIRHDTGTTLYGNKTEADIMSEYPDAERMTVDAFCEWKASQQRTPIEWVGTDEETYRDMMNVLPPADFAPLGFLVGEPTDHDAGNGQPRFAAFRKVGTKYQTASRPLTRNEFRSCVGAI